MRLPKFLRRSIGLTQAVAILMASLIISVVFSGVQLAYTYRAQQQAALELSNEILTLAEGGATTASWTLDTHLAEEVIHSVIALGDVHQATLIDESGVVLAQSTSAEKTYSRLTNLFARTIIADSIKGQRNLSVTAGGGRQHVGTLSIVMAPEHIAERFVSVAQPVVIASVFQALAIGLVLLWLSARLLTSPLRRAARAIAEIDPENTEANSIAVPAAHADNELGYLLGHTNKMIERLSTVQKQFKTLATHDPLTGLPNRSHVVTRLEQAIVRAQHNTTQVAVLFLDLDGFKTVNDSHGHTHGDDLLVQVASEIKAVLRANDSVGRLGGDEFLIVIEDISHLEDIKKTIHRIKDKLNRPFVVGLSQVRIGCSIGVALFPDDGIDTSELMRHSDMAMYQAKEKPGSHFHFFTHEMSERMKLRLNMEAALKQALGLDEFELAYQPKMNAKSGQLAGCEALLRWQHGDRLHAASEFITVAEQIGVMVEIGYCVLEWVCSQLARWRVDYQPISVAVNVSAHQLRELDFSDRVIDITSRYDIAPEQIVLEITETVLIEELSHAVKKLARLRTAGFGVSIDDFGTGYSSLSYLTYLPANSLKIDKSFVSGEQSSDVVLNMIIAVAQALKMKTVAEGIETAEQKERLINKGCDELQGYLLGRPMSASDFARNFLESK